VVETNWQAQRVGPYALLWGLVTHPDQPEAGYEAFFQKYPQWRAEHAPLEDTHSWRTLRKKLPSEVLSGNRLAPRIVATLGSELVPQVEGRLLYTVNQDHQERHGGVLREPADLAWYAPYSRPEIIRHFGTQYDPTRHNGGILWFGTNGVIITKLDTRGAKTAHRYLNHFLSDRRFSWTSQNKMTRANKPGLEVLEHAARGAALHLFVQPHSHEPAVYVGGVRAMEATRDAPMTVVFELDRRVPDDVLRELEGLARMG
jgi:hypothetical protein